MGTLRDAIAAHSAVWLAVGGLLIGMAFGAIVTRTNFCTMGSVSDILNLGDWRRFRAWLLAIAVAIAGLHLLEAVGAVEVARSMYVGRRLTWLGNLVGGLMFGFGMVYAGGCASRNLARVGSGDLRALVTLIVLGIFAYIAIGGILGPIRAWLEQLASVLLPSADQRLASVAGIDRVPVAVAVVGLIAIVCFVSRDFRSSRTHILSGLGVGLCVVAGWALTGLAFDELADYPTAPASLTFVKPAGDALEWLQRYTASPLPSFGVATVLGAVVGSCLVAILTGRFRLGGYSDLADLRRSLFGAAMMGTGGVLALGCTVGQGITGVSTLAVGSILSLVAIVVGGVSGIKMLERSLMAGA
jgi:uncharacterized membrane protein YedE/YeeE